MRREVKPEQLKNIPLDSIRPSPKQVRKDFDRDKLKRLARSIRERGLLQPITVRKKGEIYEIVHGERRYRAFKLICRKTIPAFVRKTTGKDMLIDGLIENILREDLKPIEKSKGLLELFKTINPKRLKDQNDCSMIIGRVKNWERRGEIGPPAERNNFTTEKDVFRCKDIMDMIGISANTIIECLTLLNLPDDILEKVIYTYDVTERKHKGGMITVRMAGQIARIPKEMHQRKIFEYTVKNRISLKRLNGMVNEYLRLHKADLIGTQWNFKSPKGRELNETIESMAKKMDEWRARLNTFRIFNLYHAGFLQQIDFKGTMSMLREELVYFKNKIDQLALDIENYENEKLKEARKMKGKKFEVEIRPDARFSIPSKVFKTFGFKGLRNKKSRKSWDRNIRAIISVLDMYEVKKDDQDDEA